MIFRNVTLGDSKKRGNNKAIFKDYRRSGNSWFFLNSNFFLFNSLNTLLSPEIYFAMF